MAFEHLKLNQAATEMFNDISTEMRNRKIKSLNVPLLLWGVLTASMDDSAYSVLENYLYTDNDLPSAEVETAISLLISFTEPKADNKKASHNGKSGKKSKKNKQQPTPPQPQEKEPAEVSGDEKLPEPTTTYTFTGHDGKEIRIDVNQDVEKVFEKLLEIVEKYEITVLDPLYITSAIFMCDCKDVKQFFKDLDENYDDAKNYFHADRIMMCGVIPFQLSGFLSTLNEKIDGKSPCEILGRDKEVKQIWNIASKKNKRNVILIGEPGVGKSALIEKLTHDINSGNCPEKFKRFKVVVLDVNSLIAGTTYRGQAEERIKDLIRFLEKNHDVILFVDEVHTMLGAGSCFEGEMDLANALKPILARGDTIVIGATTEEEYEKYFKKDGALTRRFERVRVKEPMVDKVYPMIQNKLIELSKFHGVNITREVVEYAILIAECFAFDKKNPDKTLDLIDRAMVSAADAKKAYVDKECVIQNFDAYFEMWDKMSDDAKKEVAYHEAGHYLVGKLSGRLIDLHWLAVSIMPAEDYLGVTVHEKDEDVIPFTNVDYYIDLMAYYFGGRVGEEKFRHEYTSGASEDLRIIDRTARRVITKLGMGCDSVKNRVFVSEEDCDLNSEYFKNLLRNEVSQLTDKAYKRAQELIDQNMDLLEAIVEALVERKIVTEIELEKIWKSVVANRTAK